ncbi:NCS2 family permease [bacterium]|nr:NCS2 family permease [bacterium]
MSIIERFFGIKKSGSTVRTEILAGIVTFMTMAYIIVVNPAILAVAGIPKGASMVATIYTAFVGTLLMGVYARRPFAIAPYMGENAFVAFTVVKVLGYSWQTALGAIFIGGILFTLLTVLKLRSWLAEAIPPGLKFSFAVGIGLFLTFIGLNDAGLVVLGVPGAPVKIGDFSSLPVLLSVIGFIILATLLLKKIKGALFLGMIATTILCIMTKVIQPPSDFISMPPSLGPIFMQLDIVGALTWGFFAVILTVFVMDFVDTMGTLIGVAARAGMLDPDGNLPEIEKPMLCDALATIVAALLGTTTAGTFIESAAGIEEGGRTGLTSVVTAFLFLAALFFSPILTMVPAQAYGPVLIIVGILMIEAITRIDFSDLSELIPAFCVIVLMSFTYNIGIGMTAGFVLYPLFKTINGQARSIHPGLWILCCLSLLFYIFYPY